MMAMIPRTIPWEAVGPTVAHCAQSPVASETVRTGNAMLCTFTYVSAPAVVPAKFLVHGLVGKFDLGNVGVANVY